MSGEAGLRDAADLAFMVKTSSMDGGVLLRRSDRDRAGLEPGDVTAEGYLLEPDPAADRVRVTRVRYVADEVLSEHHFTYHTVRYEADDMPFGEFMSSGWLGDALGMWGDGDPDARQVGNASAEVTPDGRSATARVDAAWDMLGWPRRLAGRNHDDLEAVLDASGGLELRSVSLGMSYEGTFEEALGLIALGRKCREAGIEFEDGKACVPVRREGGGREL